MATYFRDFTQEATSTPATGITPIWGSFTTNTIGPYDGSVAWQLNTTVLHSAATVTSFGTAAELLNQEIYAEFRCDQPYYKISLAMSGASTSERDAVNFNVNSDSTVAISKYANNTYTSLGTDASYTVANNTWHSVRLRIESDGTVKGKIWKTDTESEPGTWRITTAAGAVSDVDAGHPGIIQTGAY